MKTVRFSQVVERCGRPEAHALWVAPKDDREFTRAQKSHRVMTVESNGRGKAEVGVVGFDAAHPKGSQLLIFPRSLAPFAGARVVGLKFDQIEQNLEPAKRETPKRHRRKAQTTQLRGVSNATLTSDRHQPQSDAVRRQRKPPPTKKRTVDAGDQTSLKDAVLEALEEMRRGESVRAYERLRRAVDET